MAVPLQDPSNVLVKDDGTTVVTKSALVTALGSAVNSDPVYRVPAGWRLREKGVPPGGGNSTPKIYRQVANAGTLIKQSEIDQWFATPTVTAVTPNSGTASGGTAVTVKGTAFKTGNTTVSIGGVAATSVVVTDSKTLTCVTGAHATGVVTATVTTPAATSAALASAFTYV